MTIGNRDTETNPPRPAPTVATENPAAPMGEVRFKAAVDAALRHYLEPDQLRDNPLLWTHLIDTEVAGDPEPVRRVQALRHILEGQARRFRTAPKTDILYGILEATYFKPALSQTTAAAELRISTRTLRRHRRRAVTLLSAWLWAAERQHLPQPPPR